MTFFDKKEEVMKVELTALGRYKLSIGKLKPHHYRFFDNNVVYDSNAIGHSEEQNDADVRVRENTPLLKQNPNQNPKNHSHWNSPVFTTFPLMP